MPTGISDAAVARKPQWRQYTTGATTPDDVVGTLKEAFEVDLDRGATLAVQFDFNDVAGAETGLIAVEKVVGTSYVRMFQISYDATGISSINGYTAGTNALRGYEYVGQTNDATTVRVRLSQTGGVAREIRWSYMLSEGVVP